MNQTILELGNNLLNQEALDIWVEHRKAIKKPIKNLKAVEDMFSKYSHAVQMQAVEECSGDGYQGISFRLKSLAEAERKPQRKDEIGFLERHTDRSWADGI